MWNRTIAHGVVNSSRRVVLLGISLGVAYSGPLPDVLSAQNRGAAHDQHAERAITAQFLGERGAMVEVLGLRRWTTAMLRDSLAFHAPRAAVASIRLAGTLKAILGFPETAAWRQTGDSAVNVLVAVIEPEESVRVRPRALGTDTTRSEAPWTRIAEIARARLDLLTDALEAPIYARAVGLPSSIPLEIRPDSAIVRELWTLLEMHRSVEDVAAARRLLMSSPSIHDRIAAVAVLSNFEDDDAAWQALVGALRDPDERVRNIAARVLLAFRTQAPRPVDWRPAAQDLHALLDGSALSLLWQVLDLLVATSVSPELAGPLLRNGAQGVLMFAGATRPEVRRPSYRFLRVISGGLQHDGIPARWRAWIEGLES